MSEFGSGPGSGTNGAASGARWYRPRQGKIVEKSNESDPNAKKWTSTTGVASYWVEYDTLSGKLVSVWTKRRKNTHNDKEEDVVNFLLIDNKGDRHIFSTTIQDRVGGFIARCIPRMAAGGPTEFRAYNYFSKAKQTQMQGCGVLQPWSAFHEQNGYKQSRDGKAQIDPWFTKDKPNGMPEPVVHNIPNHKPIWDWSAQEAFLLKVVENFADEVAKNYPDHVYQEQGPDSAAAQQAPPQQAAQPAPAPEARPAPAPAQAAPQQPPAAPATGYAAPPPVGFSADDEDLPF